MLFDLDGRRAPFTLSETREKRDRDRPRGRETGSQMGSGRHAQYRKRAGPSFARLPKHSRYCHDVVTFRGSSIAIGRGRGPDRSTEGRRKMRWVLVTTFGSDICDRFVSVPKKSLRLFHAEEGQAL